MNKKELEYFENLLKQKDEVIKALEKQNYDVIYQLQLLKLSYDNATQTIHVLRDKIKKYEKQTLQKRPRRTTR